MPTKQMTRTEVRYDALTSWEKLPPGWSFVEVAGVATDSQDRVYVFSRGAHPLIGFRRPGRLLFSWGEPGTGPGQFNLPHGIAVARDGRVYVADRENSRIQIFTPDGKYITEWTDVARPMQVCLDRHERVYVAEVGWRAGRFPWQTPPADPVGARVSVFTPDGKLLTRWGGGDDPTAR